NCAHVYSEPLIVKLIESQNGDGRVVLGCTDAGRAKWVSSLARKLELPVAIVLKERISMTKTRQIAVHADVDDKHVIIYDDMIRTGGSLISAARSYKEKGAARITAIATHGVLPGDALEKLQSATHTTGARLFDRIIVTDSHPNAVRLSSALASDEFMMVESVAQLLWRELSGFTR
ncbi:MAG TPA: phosphoribosyltransferase family protein, partial [Chroococcales cyanobacterium]